MPHEELTNSSLLWLTLTAFLWGATNPFLKKTSRGICEIKTNGYLQRFVAEVKFLLFNWKYLFFILLNQCGSILYLVTLPSVDLTLAAPMTNFLSLIFTGIVGALLGEKVMTKGSFAGMVLIFTGVTICILSQRLEES